MKKQDIVGLTLRLPKKLKNEMLEKAKKDKRSLNQQIIVVLEAYSKNSSGAHMVQTH